MPPHGRRNLERTTPVRAAIVAVALAALSGGAARAAAADDASAALTPPRVSRFVEAPRPAGGETGAVAVELELMIGLDGTLTDARVAVSAGADFDAAALTAVQRFTFEPARRGERAVPARIPPDGHPRDLVLVSQSTLGFGEACRATLRDSVWTAPLDREGRAVATLVTYTCRFEVR